MKKVLLILPALLLAACAPTQGQKPMKYQATPSQVLSAIAEMASTMGVGTASGNFNVTSVTPNQVTLQSPQGLVLPSFDVTFTAMDTGAGATLVTHAYKGLDVRYNSPIDQKVQNIYKELAKRFPVAP